MILLRYALYVLACQLYCIRLAIYGVHRVFVFITKPGARLVVPIALLGVLFLARPLLDRRFGAPVEAFWQGALYPLLGVELFALLHPLRMEITVIAGLLLFAMLFSLAASMLRPIVGTFSAPSMPLPPLPPMIVPRTTVRTVRARLAVPKRARNGFDGELSGLVDRLPGHLQAVVRPQRRDPN